MQLINHYTYEPLYWTVNRQRLRTPLRSSLVDQRVAMHAGVSMISDPRDHPDNANLPTSNQPATILGTTIAFLVGRISWHLFSPHVVFSFTNHQQSVAFVFLSLRLWVRVKDHLWGWDDAFVVLAGTASFIGDILVCLSMIQREYDTSSPPN